MVVAVLGFLAAVLLLEAYVLLLVEQDASGSNIRTYADSVWFICVAVTTTGFGEYYPVTRAGRLVTAPVMLGGGGPFAEMASFVIATCVTARFLKGRAAKVSPRHRTRRADGAVHQVVSSCSALVVISSCSAPAVVSSCSAPVVVSSCSAPVVVSSCPAPVVVRRTQCHVRAQHPQSQGEAA